MPIDFPTFDIDTVSDDIKPDLDIVNSELEIVEPKKINPFLVEPTRKAYKPKPPSEQKELNDKIIREDKQVEKIKPKKQLSEKQKKHLENMRLKRAKKKIDKVKEDIMKTDTKQEFIEPTEEELAEMEKSEFDNWLKNMDKFERLMKKMEIEKQKKLEEERKREEALEAKYRKKFEMEQLEKIAEKQQKKVDQPKINILQQSDNPYSHLFN